MSGRKILVALTFFSLAATALAANAQTLPGERYALIVGGVGGLEEFTTKYFEQTQRIYRILVDSLGYAPEHVTYLFEDDSYAEEIDGISTAQNVRQALQKLAGDLHEDDQLLLFLVGHGSYDGEWSKFNLVGPDLKDIEYAQLLARIPGHLIFIDTSGASGPFVKKLSGPKRVIVTATKSGRQYHETTFADFLLQALTSPAADANKDRRISVAEAFTFARATQDDWYGENRRLRAEHPLLDDNGDGEGSQFLDQDSEDGQLAATMYLGPVSAEMQQTLQRVKQGKESPRDKLLLEKDRLEQAIAALKQQKKQLPPDEYAQKLETYLIQLAKTNRKLKATGSQQQQ